jgi:hypothetical protein
MDRDGLPSTTWIVVGGLAVTGGLVWAGLTWQQLLSEGSALSATAPPGSFLGGGTSLTELNPFIEATKLLAAALIGLLITAVHQRLAGHEQPVSRSLAHDHHRQFGGAGARDRRRRQHRALPHAGR